MKKTPADPLQDKRFEGAAWQQDPRFALAAQGYLHYAELVRDAIAAAPLDPRSKGQWDFAARQLLDALSPANFMDTNPEALQSDLESGGRSVVDGMGLMVNDLLKGRLTITDETAFELGRDLATTEGAVVFENPLMVFTP